MKRGREDALERPIGPLFARPADEPLTKWPDCPEEYVLDLLSRHPGHTVEELGIVAARERVGDPHCWRLRLQLRLEDLRKDGRAHTEDERGGLGLWYGGRGRGACVRPDPKERAAGA